MTYVEYALALPTENIFKIILGINIVNRPIVCYTDVQLQS